ncbi:MAG: HDOD domain-containing protein [Acidobacteriia bacterium]|nr:HDOD domain-containing protein [Terriglobia bacterium]
MSACVIPLKPGVKLGRLSGIKSLPPFPAVAARLLGLINDDNSGFREVSRLLMTDTALSSQVLRLANSAMFGFRQEVSTILKALCLVGTNRVRDIVVTVSLKNYMNHRDNVPLRDCWRHSLASALWAEMLSQYCKLDKPLSYTAGILHDLGRIALIMLLPEDYASFLEATSGSEVDPRERERELFDYDHCQIGQYLAKVWNFQPALGDVIAHHHDDVTPATPRYQALVRASCTAASMSGFHTVGPPRKWEPEMIAALLPDAGKGAPPPLDHLMERVLAELNLIECGLLQF